MGLPPPLRHPKFVLMAPMGPPPVAAAATDPQKKKKNSTRATSSVFFRVFFSQLFPMGTAGGIKARRGQGGLRVWSRNLLTDPPLLPALLFFWDFASGQANLNPTPTPQLLLGPQAMRGPSAASPPCTNIPRASLLAAPPCPATPKPDPKTIVVLWGLCSSLGRVPRAGLQLPKPRACG